MKKNTNTGWFVAIFLMGILVGQTFQRSAHAEGASLADPFNRIELRLKSINDTLDTRLREIKDKIR